MKVKEFKSRCAIAAHKTSACGVNWYFADILEEDLWLVTTTNNGSWPSYVATYEGNQIVLEVLAQAPEDALLDQFPLLSK